MQLLIEAKSETEAVAKMREVLILVILCVLYCFFFVCQFVCFVVCLFCLSVLLFVCLFCCDEVQVLTAVTPLLQGKGDLDDIQLALSYSRLFDEYQGVHQFCVSLVPRPALCQSGTETSSIFTMLVYTRL